MNRRITKDGNHDALCAVFKQMGCSVAELHGACIAGWPDLVVGLLNINHLVELKNPDTRYGRAGFNPNQQAFNRDWRGKPVVAVSTIDEVIALVTHWRTRAKQP